MDIKKYSLLNIDHYYLIKLLIIIIIIKIIIKKIKKIIRKIIINK
jgi:hypothetical protein